MGLVKLKEEYEKLQKKYKFPGFKPMNEDFYIEKIAENQTELLIREIRRFMWEKFVNYMRLLEGLINPVNVSMFILSLIKTIDSEDKKIISEIYKELMNQEVKVIKLDLEFDEAKEAQFIKESFEVWQKMKTDLANIFEKLEKGTQEKKEENNKDYFG